MENIWKKINKKFSVIIAGLLTSVSVAGGIGIGIVITKKYRDKVKTQNNYIKNVHDKRLMLSSEEKKKR